MKSVTKDQLEEVQLWLTEFNLPKLGKNIWRDFSDGVLIATLLKKLYPKLIDIHNYSPSNSTKLKLINWETLNRKVFKKINLTLSKETMFCLAKSVPGVVEKLLFDIMNYSKQVRNRSAECENELEDGDVMTVIVTKKVGDGLVHVPQKMILYSEYEKAVQEFENANEINNMLKLQITHLENLLKLKSERIESLSSSLTNKLSQRQSPFLDDLSFNSFGSSTSKSS